MKTRVTELAFKGLKLINIDYDKDERGFFIESWNKATFMEAGIDAEFVQENHTGSGKNVLRGLHMQDASCPLNKLVRCTVGEVMDVAVDMRHKSATFGKYAAVKLSAEMKNQLYIPSGFAHGFCVVGDYAEIQYKQTGYYASGHEICIAWDDPDINIKWVTKDPVISDKDKKGISFVKYMTDPEF